MSDGADQGKSSTASRRQFADNNGNVRNGPEEKPGTREVVGFQVEFTKRHVEDVGPDRWMGKECKWATRPESLQIFSD